MARASSCSVRLAVRLAPALLATVLAAPARGETPDRALARARALFDEAGELERAGSWGAAEDRLRAALLIRETPHLHYALAWALEHQRKLNAARAEYALALEQAERGAAADVVHLARARLALLNRTAPAAEAAASRRRDGPAPSQDQYAPHGRPERPSRTLPWALVGAGGALALTSATLLVASASDVAARDDATRRWCAATACVGTAATRAETPEASELRREAFEASSRGNAKQVIGVVAGGVGVVSAAIGALLLLRRGSEARARVDVTVAPGLAAATATLRF